MKRSYQEIASGVRLVGAEDPEVDQLQLVKQWLENKESGNWVMVIDNADDENLFYGEDKNRGQESFGSSQTLAQYFPRRLNGSILLTTRNKTLGVKFAKVHNVMTIPEMSVSESKHLLVENLEEEGDHDDQALTDLVEILKNLPLALVQAAAFIKENSQSISDYLQMYRESDSTRIELLGQNFEDVERDPESRNPVAVTWAISFEQIRKNDPQAAELLSLMSVLNRQGIPKSLLSLDHEGMNLERALGTLKAFSLITPEPSHEAFNLHRLVYLATRNWLSINKELDSWTGKALVLLSKLFPEGTYENREIWMTYLPHAQTVLNSDNLPASENIAQATLLFNVSRALQLKGDYDGAEIMARRSLGLRKKIQREKDLQTLHSLSNLGSVLWKQGKYEKAEDINQQVLNGFKEILGKHHPYTLKGLDDLGIVLLGLGKYGAAEVVHRRALSTREKILGKYHPDTLMSLSNMGLVLGNQGKYEEAERLHRRVLSAREKTLGYEHPNTLSSINNLADVLFDQDKFNEAEKLYRRGLGVREKVLGERHPDTLTSVNNLAHVLQKQNLVEEAAMLYKRAQSDREITLGRVGSPGPVAEQNNSQSTSQQFQDSTPVPPDIKRLHYQSDGTVPSQSSLDGNDYPRLGMFDTVVIIGDTRSMINSAHSESMSNNQVSRWSMLERSLESIINIITTHNKNGIDIQFVKHPKQNGQNIMGLDVVLDKLRIVGGLLQNSTSSTNFLDDLRKAISPYLEGFRVWKAAMAERRSFKRPKPLSLIVLTDSHANDDSEVTWYLANVAKQLDSMRAPPRQIGIQFVQIGDDEKATSWFRKLDDELGNGKFRDVSEECWRCFNSLG